MIDVLTKYPNLKKFVSHSETKDTTDMKKEKKKEKKTITKNGILIYSRLEKLFGSPMLYYRCKNVANIDKGFCRSYIESILRQSNHSYHLLFAIHLLEQIETDQGVKEIREMLKEARSNSSSKGRFSKKGVNSDILQEVFQ